MSWIQKIIDWLRNTLGKLFGSDFEKQFDALLEDLKKELQDIPVEITDEIASSLYDRFEKQFNNFLKLVQDNIELVPDEKADEMAEEFLKLLLNFMSLRFKLKSDFRRNLEGFNGKIQFRSKNASKGSSIVVVAAFENNEMKVNEYADALPDDEVTISVAFKNGKALINYLMQSESRDILQPVLNNEVTLKGNVNYLLKFGYMANHMQLALMGKLP